MSDPADFESVFKNCTHRLGGHYPFSPKDILQGLAEDLGQDENPDRYGTGKLIEDFEKEMASILGKEATVFMPSGTMAQVIALRIHSDEKKISRVGFHPTSHLELHKKSAYHELHGLDATLVGGADRLYTRADLDRVKTPLSALLVELPQREIGGYLPSWDEFMDIVAWAKKAGTRLHLDGARLWECRPFYQKSTPRSAPHSIRFMSRTIKRSAGSRERSSLEVRPSSRRRRSGSEDTAEISSAFIPTSSPRGAFIASGSEKWNSWPAMRRSISRPIAFASS